MWCNVMDETRGLEIKRGSKTTTLATSWTNPQWPQYLPFFPAFDLSDESWTPAPHWKKYLSRLWNLIVALNVKDESRQHALLLHYAGEAVNDIFDTLPDTKAGEGHDPLEKAVTALANYFEPKKNVAFEEYQFREAKQNPSEPIMTYFTHLVQLATLIARSNLK